MATYNGWANRQTWDVALWLANDEPSYRACVALAQRFARKSHRLTGANAQYFVRQTLGWDRTPDGDGLSRVRWGAIAEAIREMAAD